MTCGKYAKKEVKKMSNELGWREFLKVVDVVQTLVKCSRSDAERTADKICQDPDTIMMLGVACGFSVGAIGVGATVAKASATVQAWPVVVAGATTAFSGLYLAKRFCYAYYRQTTSRSLSPLDKIKLR